MKQVTKLFTLLGMALSATANTRHFNAPSSKRLSPRDGTRHDVGRQRKGLVGTKRLAPATTGGNWQGLPYLSLAEHDACVRASMSGLSKAGREFLYNKERASIIASR